MAAVVAKLHRGKAASRGFDLLRMVLEEYRCALAAEAHYEALGRDGISRSDTARSVFEKFYGGRATG